MMHARCHTLLCARAARFDTPLDGVFADVRDPAASSRTPRCRAGLAIAAESSSIRRRSSRATGSMRRARRKLDYYARVLEAFDKALAQGSASTTVDGKMIDVAMANAARRALDEAAAWKKAGTGWREFGRWPSWAFLVAAVLL